MSGGNDVIPNSKFINIDEIFADCFMDTDQELMGLISGNNGGGGAGSSSGSSSTDGMRSGNHSAASSSAGGAGSSAMFNMAGGQHPQLIGGGQGGPMRYTPPMPQGSSTLFAQQSGMHQQQPMGVSQQSPPPPAAAAAPASTSKPSRRSAAAAAAATAASSGATSGTDSDSRPSDKRKRPRTAASSSGGGGSASTSGRNMSEQQKLERRERNREHAKRSRVRKKFLLESLQKSVTALQDENDRLRSAIKDNCEDAKELLAKSEAAGVLAATPGDATRVLDDPDYSLVKALQTAQQNFVITDPTLPDNPIVFASQGFLDLTGYTLEQVLGRNCRFLQGPDTDPKAVEKIRKAIENGCDTSVCLLNYRVDGTTFWNQFFIAALRDAEGKIINYVGVQCKVSEEFVLAMQKQDDGNDEDDASDEDEDM